MHATFLPFIKTIKDYYATHGRQFPWRDTWDPYKIVVSEIMLQQTQTYRVLPKYEQWLEVFPTFQHLADADLIEVLGAWQGLGYNRRGKALHEIAKKVVHEFDGILPDDPELLITFPGIGPATAASISAFAFNTPTTFIETNVRAVYIHFFFPDRDAVSDKELLPLIEATVDQDNAREWYYALMDYGVILKKKLVNPSRRSKHHTKQSTFQGSDRQIRGAVIRLLTHLERLERTVLIEKLAQDVTIKALPERSNRIIDRLLKEKMIRQTKNIMHIS